MPAAAVLLSSFRLHPSSFTSHPLLSDLGDAVGGVMAAPVGGAVVAEEVAEEPVGLVLDHGADAGVGGEALGRVLVELLGGVQRLGPGVPPDQVVQLLVERL